MNLQLKLIEEPCLTCLNTPVASASGHSIRQLRKTSSCGNPSIMLPVGASKKIVKTLLGPAHESWSPLQRQPWRFCEQPSTLGQPGQSMDKVPRRDCSSQMFIRMLWYIDGRQTHQTLADIDIFSWKCMHCMCVVSGSPYTCLIVWCIPPKSMDVNRHIVGRRSKHALIKHLETPHLPNNKINQIELHTCTNMRAQRLVSIYIYIRFMHLYFDFH